MRTRRLASRSRHRSRSCGRSSGALSSCPRTRAPRTCRRRLCGGSLFVSARGCCGLYARRTAILVGAWDATLRLVAKATDDGAMAARAAAPSGMGTTEPLDNRREVERRRGVSGAPRSVRQMLRNRRRGARAYCALSRPSSMRQKRSRPWRHGAATRSSPRTLGTGRRPRGYLQRVPGHGHPPAPLQLRSCTCASRAGSQARPGSARSRMDRFRPRAHYAQRLRKPRCRPTPCCGQHHGNTAASSAAPSEIICCLSR